MKIQKYIIGLLALVLLQLFQSCKKEMIDLNTNPTIVSSAPPEFQFTSATADMDYNTRQQLINRYQFMVYMQYIVPDGPNANLQAAYWTPGATTGPGPSVSYYSDYFNGMGVQMNNIIKQIGLMSQAQQASYAYLKAICQILNVYEAWKVADLYGALPYSQAFNSVQYPLPAYDYDWTLYKTFDSTLKVAATVLKNNEIPASFGQQDLFYGSSPAGVSNSSSVETTDWEAAANSLRIRIALRYQKRDAANLASVLNDIQSNFSAQIISSNAQSFGYNHTQTWNDNQSDISALMSGYDAGYAFVAYLKSTNDPRLALMVRQNDGGTNSTAYNTIISGGTPAALSLLADSSAFVNSRYWGKHAFFASQSAPYGWTGAGRYELFPLTNGTVTNLGVLSCIQSRYLLKNGGLDDGLNTVIAHTDESTSAIGTDPSTIKNTTWFLTYAETCFMMAEIAQEGGNGLGQSAAQWYNNGVNASYAQYLADAKAGLVPGASTINNDSTAMTNFLNSYPYDGTLQRIYSQEWVHLLIEPEEAYAMWKRTGYPEFVNNFAGQPSTIGDGSGTAYLESLWNGNADGIIPRRSAFTITGNLSAGSTAAGMTLNQNNFNSALSTMETFNTNYGSNANYTIGRIWWDMQ